MGPSTNFYGLWLRRNKLLKNRNILVAHPICEKKQVKTKEGIHFDSYAFFKILTLPAYCSGKL